MPGVLTHTPAHVVRQLMVDLALGVTPPGIVGQWPIFVRKEPDTPDDVITVYNTVGTDSGRTHFDGEVQEHHGIQVRIRGADEATAEAKTRAIHIALAQVFRVEVVVGSSTYLVQSIAQGSAIGLTGPAGVNPLGYQPQVSKRSLFTINALVSVRQSLIPGNAYTTFAGEGYTNNAGEYYTTGA
jgi:hypothetical protein